MGGSYLASTVVLGYRVLSMYDLIHLLPKEYQRALYNETEKRQENLSEGEEKNNDGKWKKGEKGVKDVGKGNDAEEEKRDDEKDEFPESMVGPFMDIFDDEYHIMLSLLERYDPSLQLFDMDGYVVGVDMTDKTVEDLKDLKTVSIRRVYDRDPIFIAGRPKVHYSFGLTNMEEFMERHGLLAK